jgi:hypothetical protein
MLPECTWHLIQLLSSVSSCCVTALCVHHQCGNAVANAHGCILWDLARYGMFRAVVVKELRLIPEEEALSCKKNSEYRLRGLLRMAISNCD